MSGRPTRRGAARERGIALVVVLMLLLIVTLIGLAAMRGTLMQERMAGNVAARGVAFQIAEGALRDAEAFIEDGPAMPATGAACSGGLCPIPNPADAPRWESDGFWDTTGNYRAYHAPDAPEGSTARYMVEYMGLGQPLDCTTEVDVSAGSSCASTVRNYRITAISRLENGTDVILQSMYQVE
jgi:type IV pilus assembly protein PilX